MKKPLQGLLIAGEELRDLTLSGKKQITIREGHRSYDLGPILIGCHLLNWATKKEVVSVTHTILEAVSINDLRDDGFNDCFEALESLQRWYPNLTLASEVTVIRWR